MRNPQKKNKPVPDSFARCLNEKCKQANSCLRRLALLQTTPETHYFSIVNPASVSQDAAKCPFFVSSRKLRMAWGMKHLLDNVPYKTAYSLRYNLLAYYGKSHYYCCFRGERYITPTEQAYIRNLFLQYGIKEEPVYDDYTEEYSW